MGPDFSNVRVTTAHIAELRGSLPGTLLVIHRYTGDLRFTSPGEPVPDSSGVVAGQEDLAQLRTERPDPTDELAAEQFTDDAFRELYKEPLLDPPPSIVCLRKALASLGIYLNAAPGYWPNPEGRWIWWDYYVFDAAPYLGLNLVCGHQNPQRIEAVLYSRGQQMANWHEPLTETRLPTEVANSFLIALEDYRDPD